MPFGHWKALTFIAGLRHDRIDAPWVTDGPINGDAFRVYVHDILGPTLRPGDVVVLDNLPAHQIAGIREAVAARRAKLFYLPPYSPELHPIEMAFAKLKALLRPQPARTVNGLIQRIGNLLDRFLPSAGANAFNAAGYQRPIAKCSSSPPMWSGAEGHRAWWPFQRAGDRFRRCIPPHGHRAAMPRRQYRDELS